MGRQLRPITAWYGALDLFPHLVTVLRRDRRGRELRRADGYDAASDRKAVARTLETEVRRLTMARCGGGPLEH